ncbi:hypothetical protein BGX30_014111 [Mortierella sp. GBA39]|nr:hypothetical protein BGX30_014111 [Mortierella sp. GBA39]
MHRHHQHQHCSKKTPNSRRCIHELQGQGPTLLPELGPHRQPDSSREIKIYKDTMKNLWIDGGFKPRWLHDNVNFPLLEEACCHCTYCQANISQILYKLQPSSLREYNRPRIASKACILDRTRTGQDLIDRSNHGLRYIPDNHDVPEVVNQDREKYKYLLTVHGTPNAGYLDVDPNKPL